MSRPVEIEIGAEIRRYEAEELPLAIGGPHAELPLLGIDAAEPVAYIGIAEDQLFVQPQGSEPVTCNGTPIGTAQWLYDGDVVRIGANRIVATISPTLARFSVQRPSSDNVTVPPSSLTLKRADGEEASSAAPAKIKPVEFKPPGGEKPAAKGRRFRPLQLLIWIPLLLLGGAAWFVLTARSIEIVVEPTPERMEFHGGLSRLGISFEGRHLVRPGSYTLEAELAGYERLEVPVVVTRKSNQTHRFEMLRLPGTLTLNVGVEGAAVFVDGAEAGRTPLPALELATGEHELRVVAERYEEFVETVTIEGGGVEQSLDVELVARFAPVRVRSEPAGAEIRANGETVGTTPATVELVEGGYTLELRLAGYKTERRRIEVRANEPQELPAVRLRLTDGRLVLRSEPPGATVTVDGNYRGTTPLELVLTPGESFEVELSKRGFKGTTRQVRVASGRTQEMEVELAAQLGEVTIRGAPQGAQLWVNGEPRGDANQTLRLVAVEHSIEVRKEGYESLSTTVTPRPGLPQSVDAALKSAQQLKQERMPPKIRTAQGQQLVLVEGGRLRMGAPRREPGRRSNEIQRDVELMRPFYIGVREVSNDEFRRFRNEHNSGKAGGTSLDIGHHPVVRVSWEDAALYCNWLSQQEGLPPAYRVQQGTLMPVRPPTTGYRLPTEAEWALVARRPGGGETLKYAWGSDLPLPEDSGNYGDSSAEYLLDDGIDDYDDHYPATAPVGSFEPNPLGLFNLGGNVSEWVQDYYSVPASNRGQVERDPLGPAGGEEHVIRGASWMDTVVSEIRLSYRDRGFDGRPDVGFRIARYAE
jgi:formylglycine-generating enzyme required for sulfatase activity